MYKTLHSLICISIDSDILTTSVVETWFRDLVNIRMLRFISCQLKALPENVGNLVHLRYLDISACEFDRFPDSFWHLYKLEILDARNCKIQYGPKDIIKLVNLRRVGLKDDLIRQLGSVPRVGNLVFLQEMPYYAVGDEPGRTIHELKNMNHLRGILEISGLCSVIGMEESAEAALDKKIYLDTLILSWHESIRPLKFNSIQEMEVLEGLCPSSNIKHLEVKFYMGARFHPSWLHEDMLISLASLSISSCPNISTLFDKPSRTDGSSNSTDSFTGFRSLTKLCITWCKRLTGLDNLLQAEYLPAIKVVRISNCEDLVSLPTKSLVEFVHLEDLEVSHCWSLNWEQGLTLPPSLKLLKLEACGEFSDSTLSCLLGLAALTNLDLQFCPSIESICVQIWSDLVALESLKIVCCQGLSSIGGSEPIARIKNVDIRHCPKLKELQQPFQRGCFS
jgi:Leucine-rich repeat (LRR) protein